MPEGIIRPLPQRIRADDSDYYAWCPECKQYKRRQEVHQDMYGMWVDAAFHRVTFTEMIGMED